MSGSRFLAVAALPLILALTACGGQGDGAQSGAVSMQEQNAQAEPTPERAAPVIRRAQ